MFLSGLFKESVKQEVRCTTGSRGGMPWNPPASRTWEALELATHSRGAGPHMTLCGRPGWSTLMPLSPTGGGLAPHMAHKPLSDLALPVPPPSFLLLPNHILSSVSIYHCLPTPCTYQTVSVPLCCLLPALEYHLLPWPLCELLFILQNPDQRLPPLGRLC